MSDTMWGSDAEQLEQLGSQLDGAADALRTTAQTLHQALSWAPWDGGDAELFRSDWNSVHRVQLESAAQHLVDASEVLRRNAADQRQASDATSGGAGGPGAGGTAPGDGDGVPFGQEVQGGPKPIDRALADLAGDAYDYEPDGSSEGLPDGWERLAEDDLGDLGLTRDDLIDPDTGFQAGVYRNAEGEYVLAFAGTEFSELEDWKANIAQGAGFETAQYNQARELATKLKASVGDELVITGHSLGGGLAAYAALGTDTPAVTYNAAGLSNDSLESLGFEPSDGRAAAEGSIRNYRVESDILTYLQEDKAGIRSLAPDAVGSQLTIADPTPAPSRPSVKIPFTDKRIGIDPLTTSDHGIKMHKIGAVKKALDGDPQW